MEKLIFADTVKKGIHSLVRVPKVVIDDPIFRLHYRATGMALFFFSLLVSGYQFFGKPIMCIQRDDIPEQLLNTYCWIEGTFTLPKALTKRVGHEVIYPGVEKYENGDDVIEHSYYQWVFFVLLLQGVLLCAPYFIWHKLEGGRMKTIIQKLKAPALLRKDRDENYKALEKYFVLRYNQHQHYALKYLLCEVLNFINVIGQIYFLDKFLGGYFTTYGADVVRYVNEEQANRTDPMIKLFPRITKCTFHKYGSSGDVQKHDALCLLPLNIINEKVFVVIWFWFIILAILGGLLLIYRLVILLSVRARYILMTCVSSLSAKEDVSFLIPFFSYGDWFLLYMLADNIDNLHFKKFLLQLKSQIVEMNEREKREALERKRKKQRAIEPGETQMFLPPPTEVDV